MRRESAVVRMIIATIKNKVRSAERLKEGWYLRSNLNPLKRTYKKRRKMRKGKTSILE